MSKAEKSPNTEAPQRFRYGLFAVGMVAIVAASGCGADGRTKSVDDGGSRDALNGAKSFEVTELQVKSYDTSDPDVPIYSSVASVLFGTFPTDPLAVQYTVEYINPDLPSFEASATWSGKNIDGVHDPVPPPFDQSEGVVPGYDGGIVGPDWYIRITGEGCQSGAGGACQPGTESTLATEMKLRAIGGKLKVTIDYE